MYETYTLSRLHERLANLEPRLDDKSDYGLAMREFVAYRVDLIKEIIHERR
jgi:hypothetical protein